MVSPQGPAVGYQNVPAPVELALAAAVAEFELSNEESPEEEMEEMPRGESPDDRCPQAPSDTTLPLETPSQLSNCDTTSISSQITFSSQDSSYFGGTREYFGAIADVFYGEGETSQHVELERVDPTKDSHSQEHTPIVKASAAEPKPLVKTQPAQKIGQQKAFSLETRLGGAQMAEELVETQRQKQRGRRPFTRSCDNDNLPVTPPPSKKEPKKVMQEEQEPLSVESGLRRSDRRRTPPKPFIIQPPVRSSNSRRARQSPAYSCPPRVGRGRPRKELNDLMGDRSSKTFWIRIVGIQRQRMRTMAVGAYNRQNTVAFARDSWDLLGHTFAYLNVKARSLPMHRLVKIFLSNSIKMYELLTLKGYQEVFVMLPKFVRAVLKKYLSVPRRIHDHIPQWIQAKDAILMVCSQLTQTELMLTILTTIVDVQKGFLDTWSNSKRTPVDMNLDYVCSAANQIGELVTALNARMAQSRHVNHYDLLF